MKTRTKLKRWFKEANRTISKYFMISHQKKHKTYNASKDQHANISVSKIQIASKKKTCDKHKSDNISRLSGTISLTKSKKSTSRPSSKLGKSSDLNAPKNHKLNRISSSVFQNDNENLKKDKDYYKKLMSTLQLAALISTRKRDVDSKWNLHKCHTFASHEIRPRKGEVERRATNKESLSATSSKVTSSVSTKLSAIHEFKKLLRRQDIALPEVATSNTKSSKLLDNSASYNSIKAKFFQMRKCLVNRKISVCSKENSSCVQEECNKEMYAGSAVKISPEIQPNNKEVKAELLMQMPINYSVVKASGTKQSNFQDEFGVFNGLKTVSKMQNGQNLKRKRISKEAADRKNYVAQRQSTSKANMHQDNIIEVLRCDQSSLLKQSKNEYKGHKDYVTDRSSPISVQMVISITKTEDSTKLHEVASYERSHLIKQRKFSNETSDCRKYVIDKPSPTSVEMTKIEDGRRNFGGGPSHLSKQMKTSADYVNEIPDRPASSKHIKINKSVMKVQNTKSLSLVQKTCRNYTSDKMVTSTKSSSKFQNAEQKQSLNTPSIESAQRKKNRITKEQPSVITIKDVPRCLTPASENSVSKKGMNEGVRSMQTAFPLLLQKHAHKDTRRSNRASSGSKKKSKKSSSRSSSCSTASSNSHSHSCNSSRETSSSSRTAFSSRHSSPAHKRPNKSCSSCLFRKRNKNKSPAPSPHRQNKRADKASSVSFWKAPNRKISYTTESCQTQKQIRVRKSSSYCFRGKSSKSKRPRFCAKSRRKSETFEKKAAGLNANKDLQRPPIVQPVLGMCTLEGCRTRVYGVKYAIVKITYFEHYTTYEMMRSTDVKPKNIPNYVEKIFVTKETQVIA